MTQVDDLAALVRALVRHVPDDKKIKARALDYLRRHGLMGNILREDSCREPIGADGICHTCGWDTNTRSYRKLESI